jgi:hypothetical protein
MKYLLSGIIFFGILLVTECAEEPYDIAIYFTSPSDIAVQHGGYYRIESTGDSIGMYGQTPSEYSCTLEHDDIMLGAYWKDTTEAQDTLHFELYVDGELVVNEYLTDPQSGGEFRVPEIGEE